MPVVFTCSQGHQWVPQLDGITLPGSQAVYCPVCGSASQPTPQPDRAAQATQITAILPKAAGQEEVADFKRGLESPAAGGDRPTIPGYEILGELGRGGMGVVYRARQIGLNRIVALKMILAGAHSGEQELARFRIEAEAVASLQHPNIVQIYEVGERDGWPYFSLEFVDGGSLAQVLTGTPLPALQAAQLIEILARAVYCAHQRGIVHRDLKPVNVLLTADGMPKITDFGLAKRLGSEVGQTRTGAIMGTPSYMAPEQARGKTKEIGPAADQYALGTILYEMLTGRPPFRGETPLETILQVTSNEPVPPTRLNPKVPRDLETICLKCLQKEARKRYATAEELADDLRRFRSGEPIRARPISFWERGIRWAKRRPAAAALMAVSSLGSLLLVGGLVVSNVLISEKQKETDRALRDLTTANQDLNKQQRLTEEALLREQAAVAERTRALEKERQTSYFHRVDLADREWWTNNVARAEELLDACPPELRHWEWYYLKRLCQADLLTLRGQADPAAGVAVSPDGERVAAVSGMRSPSGDARREVKIWDIATGRELFTIGSHETAITCVAFSPDGKRLASASDDGTLKVWDVASRGGDLTSPLLHLRGPTGAVGCLAFSPDGTQLASAGRDTDVHLWDLTTGKKAATLRGHTEEVLALAYDPDGRFLASGGGDKTVRVWDTTTEKAVTLQGHADAVLSVAFSPDGKRLASASWDRIVKVWDAGTGQEVLTSRGFLAGFRSLAFNADGQQLASAGADHAVKVWDANTGEEVHTFRGHDAAVVRMAFSRDGKRLVSAGSDGTVKVWDATSGQQARTLRGHVGEVHGVAISPDGLLLASAGRDKTIQVRQAKTGQEVFTLTGHGDEVTHVAFSRDGKLLASASVDHTVKVWDARTGKEVFTLTGHEREVYGVAFSRDGRRLASASADRTVKLWDLSSGLEVRTFREHRGTVTSVVFSPDGRTIASAGGDNTVRIRDATTGLMVSILTGHTDWIWSLAFTPDGQSLASASHDQTIRVWDLATDQVALTLRGHGGEINSVVFSADGQRLFSASDDETVKIWETQTGQEILTLRGHGAAVKGLAFSAISQYLASAGRDGTVRIWDAPGAVAP